MNMQTAEHALRIENLTIGVGERDMVKGISLVIRPGEIHVLMGPNGSGKSSLAYAVAGHPEYLVKSGSIFLGAENLLPLPPEERAKRGLFLSFQEPPEVGGVSMRTFLTTIRDTKTPVTKDPLILQTLADFGLEESFLLRFLNEGFSGGEKKKSEILQLRERRPKIAILDEIDSGVDVDSLDAFARTINDLAGSGTGVLLISHSSRLFDRLDLKHAHVLIDGKIAASGGRELLEMVAREGYAGFIKQPIAT